MAFMSTNTARFLEDLLAKIRGDSRHMMGYPATRLVDFTPLYPFFEFFLNNIGDPCVPSSYRINTHDVEREVIAWFRTILRAQNSDVWGYVTGGGTEGNMYGLYLARELFPNGIVYYSEDTHYSVAKVLRMVNIRSIMIKSRPDGEIDYDDLAATLSVHRDVPPIIFANIGTTMRGAIDNLDRIKTILKDRAFSRYYIHADAALSGMVLPFVDKPQPFGFDAGIDSIAISGHKMPGIPMPCGIAMARREHVKRIARAVEYIGTSDTTVAGSRSGLAPLFFWYLINTVGEDGFREAAARCLATADYAIELFAGAGIRAWRHPHSITVIFPRDAEPVLKKWQIATQGNDAHIVVMPHITKKEITSFIHEYTTYTKAQEAA